MPPARSSTAASPASYPGAECPEDLVEYFSSFQQIVSYLYDPDLFFEQNLPAGRRPHYLHGPRRSSTIARTPPSS